MFGFSKSSSTRRPSGTNVEHDLIGRKISLKLGENILTLNSDCQWTNERNDLDAAEDTIFELINENEIIANEATALKRQLVQVKKEWETSNKLKSVTMDMLMTEREETSKLHREIKGYQDELKNCYKMIIELRKLVVVSDPGR